MAHISTDFFPLSDRIRQLSAQAEAAASAAFARIDHICETNSHKVLAAFMAHRVSESHLLGTSGYGYGDRGRDTLDAVFAQVLGAEDALVRHSFVSGTNAIVTALFGVLRPGDTMLSLSGRPYDTLHAALGIGDKAGQNLGSLQDFGIAYKELPLLETGRMDLAAIPEAVKGVKVAYLQRSRGYSLRPSITIDEIEAVAKLVKEANPEALLVVDNCYGEFVETREPTQVGADLMMGSLIKNPGGGIARTGGYIAGRKDLVELCAHRMTAPGMGREVGCTLGENKNMYMGLFYAPTVVAAALKTAVFAASLFGAAGFAVTPAPDEMRTDIIQTVVLNSPEGLSAFCRGIQKGAPIDSFVVPEAWDMPGYDDPVIMAAGAFNMGASIELSADGPMREPYAAWMQGGLTWPSGKLGVMLAAQSLADEGLL
ncbi:methionine gamma-lyase family protein [Ruminococcaceae bacterium OttesenSCG-928-L11]|nr:methionine gamma-lyase family protein [Ruminococcaceae bacterium OttesenSCG-928-L11]